MKQNKLLFTLLLLCTLCCQASKKDSLLQLLDQYTLANNQTGTMEIYEELGLLCFTKADYQASLEKRLIALKIATELGNTTKQIEINYALGATLDRLKKYPKALNHYFVAIKLCEQHGNMKYHAKSFLKISAIHTVLGDYEKAFQYQLNALEKLSTAQDTTDIPNVYYEMGSTLFYQTKYSEALEYYDKALESFRKQGKKNKIYNCLAALGSVYGEMDNQPRSLEYSLQSLEYAEQLDYIVGKAYSMYNISQNRMLMGNFEQALKDTKLALQLMKEAGDPIGELYCIASLGELYSKIGQHQTALPYIEDVVKKAQKAGEKTHLQRIYLQAADAYYRALQFEQAFVYQKKYIALKDTLVNAQTLNSMGNMKAQYDINKAESEQKITLLEKDNEILEQNNKIKKLYIFVAAILGFALFLFTIILFKNNRLQKQSNRLLKEKNKEIHLQNQKLASSNKDLEQFAYIASHDLKEPLRMIGGYSTLLERRYVEQFDSNAKEYMGFIVEAVDRMYKLLGDILDYSKINNIEAPHEWISVKETVQVITQSLKSTIDESQAIVKVGELPVVYANRTQFMQLFQNLISNALKFRTDKQTPLIYVDCKIDASNYTFTVQDNGIGIEKEYWEKIFGIFQRLNGRDVYKGTGVGLAICKKIVEQYEGKIWVNSEEGKGSTFYMSFPIQQLQPIMKKQQVKEKVMASLN